MCFVPSSGVVVGAFVRVLFGVTLKLLCCKSTLRSEIGFFFFFF